MTVCTVDDCGKPRRSPGCLYCNTHYFRLRRTGTLAARPWHRRTVCSVEGCEKPEQRLTMCSKHAQRQDRHGSPLISIPHADRALPRGEAHPGWAGNRVGYTSAHQRVYRVRGPASGNRCVDCGHPARHWSYDHEDPEEITTPQGYRYSGDPEHYVPRCVPCHTRGDMAFRRLPGLASGMRRDPSS